MSGEDTGSELDSRLALRFISVLPEAVPPDFFQHVFGTAHEGVLRHPPLATAVFYQIAAASATLFPSLP